MIIDEIFNEILLNEWSSFKNIISKYSDANKLTQYMHQYFGIKHDLDFKDITTRFNKQDFYYNERSVIYVFIYTTGIDILYSSRTLIIRLIKYDYKTQNIKESELYTIDEYKIPSNNEIQRIYKAYLPYVAVKSKREDDRIKDRLKYIEIAQNKIYKHIPRIIKESIIELETFNKVKQSLQVENKINNLKEALLLVSKFKTFTEIRKAYYADNDNNLLAFIVRAITYINTDALINDNTNIDDTIEVYSRITNNDTKMLYDVLSLIKAHFVRFSYTEMGIRTSESLTESSSLNFLNNYPGGKTLLSYIHNKLHIPNDLYITNVVDLSKTIGVNPIILIGSKGVGYISDQNMLYYINNNQIDKIPIKHPDLKSIVKEYIGTIKERHAVNNPYNKKLSDRSKSKTDDNDMDYHLLPNDSKLYKKIKPILPKLIQMAIDDLKAIKEHKPNAKNVDNKLSTLEIELKDLLGNSRYHSGRITNKISNAIHSAAQYYFADETRLTDNPFQNTMIETSNINRFIDDLLKGDNIKLQVFLQFFKQELVR